MKTGLCTLFLALLAVAPLAPQSFDWTSLNPAIVKVTAGPGKYTGTGIVVGGDEKTTYILTAAHVVNDILADASRILVQFPGSKPIEGSPGQRVYRPPTSDLAIVNIGARPPRKVSLTLGSTWRLKIGQPVTAIGHPGENDWLPAINNEVLSLGFVSDKRLFGFKVSGTEEGNSGGPVFSRDGELVGIVYRIAPAQTIAVKIEEVIRTLEAWHVPTNNLVYRYETELRAAKSAYNLGDRKRAYPLLVEAERLGSAEAAYLLSQVGKSGQPPERATADRYVAEAAEWGFPPAMRERAIKIETSDPDKAAELLLNAADAGDVASMIEVGHRFRGTKPSNSAAFPLDAVQAYNWFIKAAPSSGEAALEVARAIDSGKGVIRDHAIACQWYKKAGEDTGLTGAVAGAEFQKSCVVQPQQTAPRTSTPDTAAGPFCTTVRRIAEAGRSGYATLRQSKSQEDPNVSVSPIGRDPAYVANIQLPGFGDVIFVPNRLVVVGIVSGLSGKKTAQAQDAMQNLVQTLEACFPHPQVFRPQANQCPIQASDLYAKDSWGPRLGHRVDGCWTITDPGLYGSLVVEMQEDEVLHVPIGSKAKAYKEWVPSGDLYFLPPGGSNKSTSNPGGDHAPAAQGRIPAGTKKVNPADGLPYAWIPPGSFMMGCSPKDSECRPDELPAHQVEITRGFWLGQTEVTRASYVGVMGQDPVAIGKSEDAKLLAEWGISRKMNPNLPADLPVDYVDWQQANQYCGKVGMRLPTEAEWEYAARAGTTASRYGDPAKIGWYMVGRSRPNGPQRVGLKAPNGWGLFDMLGNLWEWTSDWYDRDYYRESPGRDPAGPAAGDKHVLRGGGWGAGADLGRASQRAYGPIDSDLMGFRCAGDLR